MVNRKYLNKVVVVTMDDGATHEGVLKAVTSRSVKVVNSVEVYFLPVKEIADIELVESKRFVFKQL